MQFPSSILSIFSKHDGTLSPDDAVIAVPPALLPVLELPQTVREIVAGFVAPNVDSFMHDNGGTFVNTVAQDITVATFNPGLWDVRFFFRTVSDFTDLAARDFVWWVDPADPANKFCIIVSYARITNQQNSTTWYQRVAFDRPINMNIGIAATGVGQTTRYNHHLFANRLG